MTHAPPVCLLAAALLLVGCSSSSSSSAATTSSSTVTVAAPTTSTTTRPAPKPTTKTHPAAHATYASCALSQLALDYYGKANRHGDDFAQIRIRDVSPLPCVLTGPIAVVGIGSGGTTDTPTLSYPVGAGIVLSPDAVRVSVTGSGQPGEIVAELSLAADYRDEPTTPKVPCNRQGVTPSSWRLTFPSGTVTVANAALKPTPGTTGSTGLATCRGELNAAAPVIREPV